MKDAAQVSKIYLSVKQTQSPGIKSNGQEGEPSLRGHSDRIGVFSRRIKDSIEFESK